MNFEFRGKPDGCHGSFVQLEPTDKSNLCCGDWDRVAYLRRTIVLQGGPCCGHDWEPSMPGRLASVNLPVDTVHKAPEVTSGSHSQ